MKSDCNRLDLDVWVSRRAKRPTGLGAIQRSQAKPLTIVERPITYRMILEIFCVVTGSEASG
jgi:hypothetical protein